MNNAEKTVLILVAILAVCAVQTCYASSNWVQVTKFTGSASENTQYFTCTHAEWLLNWTYTPAAGKEQYAFFGVTVYDNKSNLVDSVTETGNTTTQGTTYEHDAAGTFYLSLDMASLNYTIVVMQDTNSVPEFPVIGSLLAVVGLTVAVAVCQKRFNPKRA